jgi:hypothetical protein
MRILSNVYFILLTLICVCLIGLSACKTGGKMQSINATGEKGRQSCVFDEQYSAEQRRAFYPFYQAVRVELVAFKPSARNGIHYATSNSDAFGKPSVVKNETGLTMNADGTVEVRSVDERVTLGGKEVDELSNLLYNYRYRDANYQRNRANCYAPRNAIVFYNESGKPFAFLELCFECQDFEAFPSKIRTGEFCDGKWDALKALFRSAGVQYGVSSN